MEQQLFPTCSDILRLIYPLISNSSKTYILSITIENNQMQVSTIDLVVQARIRSFGTRDCQAVAGDMASGPLRDSYSSESVYRKMSRA